MAYADDEVKIRQAAPADVAATCELVRNSITELCVEDHHGDAATIAAWHANKTNANFEAWISSPRHIALIAEKAGTAAGFALLNLNGTIALLYVAPAFRFGGVSKAMLAAIEERAMAAGITELRLESTATALPFYERRGFRRSADCVPGFGATSAYPLSKSLAPGV